MTAAWASALTALAYRAGGQTDEWVAEAGLAPPVGPGTTELLDHVLPVDLHAFCHKFLADGVCSHPHCFWSGNPCMAYTQQH